MPKRVLSENSDDEFHPIRRGRKSLFVEVNPSVIHAIGADQLTNASPTSETRPSKSLFVPPTVSSTGAHSGTTFSSPNNAADAYASSAPVEALPESRRIGQAVAAATNLMEATTQLILALTPSETATNVRAASTVTSAWAASTVPTHEECFTFHRTLLPVLMHRFSQNASYETSEYNRRAYLNELLDKPAPTHTGKPGRKGKAGRDQIADNAAAILADARIKKNTITELLHLGPCLEYGNSVNYQGRPVKSIKWQLPNGNFAKRDFFAYHVTWVAANGRIPDCNLSYSHRCHNAICVAPLHGLWKRLAVNSARYVCEGNSHLILPNGAIITVCKHTSCCCSPRIIMDWNDVSLLRAPSKK